MERQFYYDTRNLDFAYSELKNGVKITPYITACVRALLASNQKIPSPINQPHEFCAILASPNPILFHNQSPLLLNIIWQAREDVRSAVDVFESAGFMQWFESSGSFETESEWLLPIVRKDSEVFRDPLDAIINIYQERDDLQASFPCAISDSVMFVRFVQWLHAYGVEELDITVKDIILLESAREEASSILELYRRRRDLQSKFWRLWDSSVASIVARRV